MKTICFNICAFLKHWSNEFFNLYKYSNNVLTGMFIMLMLVFCQQGYSVIEDECDKDEDKIEWKKSSLKSIFFDDIINAYSSWCRGNNVKTAIIGSTGISILNGDSCLNDIKDIDIIINDKEEAGRLITHLNSIVQGVIYTIKDDNLTDLVTIGYRPVGENKELSDKAPECGKITMFDIKSNEPIAAVDIVVKDLGDNDQMFVTCEYSFKYGCKAENKEKASIPVLSPASYAMLDYSSMKSDVEYFRNCGDGAEVILDDHLKEVLYACQNLHKVRTRFHFYERLKREKSDDVELMMMIDKVSSSYGDLLKKINKKAGIVEMIHKKACAFDYVLDSASDLQHLLTHAEWVKVLWDDFSICENDTDAVSFYYSLTKAINANCIIKERFLKSVNKIQIENSGVASGIVTPSLVGVFIHEWISMLISALCNDKNDGDEKSIPLTVFSNVVNDGAFLNDSEIDALRRESTDFFSCLNPLLPLVLSTGIPIMVFSPAKDGKRVISTLLSPDYAWRKWPLLMEVLSKIGSFITTENTLMKDLVFIAHSGSDRYYLCMKKFAKAKIIDPLLTAEELLLGKEEYAFEISKAYLDKEFTSDLHAMGTIMKPCGSGENIAEVHDCDEYMELEKKLDNMCLGENNEIVMGAREIKEGGAVRSQYDCLTGAKIHEDSGGNKSEKTSSLIERALRLIDFCGDLGIATESIARSIYNTSFYRNTIDTSNVDDIMGCVLDAVSITCKKEQNIIVNLDKCGDAIKQLSYADDLGCPLAPLIIGVYQITKLVNKGIGSKQVIDIIKYFTKAVLRGNRQGVSCLYWLAEMTGSPQAFSLSMSFATIFNKYFSDKIVLLSFVLPQIRQNGLDAQCNTLLPIVVGMCSSQKNNIEVSNVLKKKYPRYSELGEDSSLWGLGQSTSVADRIAYASHLAFYYLYSGDREKASIEFKKAVFAYAWLVGKTDDVLVIPNIIKATGRSALYNVINCEKDSSYQYNDDFNILRSCVEKEGGVCDFLWAVKSKLSDGMLSPIDCFRNKIKFFVIKKSEGVVFENNNALEEELFEHNVLLDCNTIKSYRYVRYTGSNIFKLNLAGAGSRRKINKYKRQPSRKTVHNVRGCDGIYELFLGGAKAVDKVRRLNRAKIAKLMKGDSDLYETNNMVAVFMLALNEYIKTSMGYIKRSPGMMLGNDCADIDRLKIELREKYTATFNDIVSQFSVIDLIIDGDQQGVKHLFMGVYNVLSLFMPKLMIFTAENKLDASVVERVLELASIVFNESGDNFDDYHSSYNINIFSFKLSCLLLLNPINYININLDMQEELIKSLLVNIVIFTKSLGVDMNKVGKDNASLKQNISSRLIWLLICLISCVDDRELCLLVIDIVCTRIVGVEVDGLLTTALVDYFISVESEVNLGNREEAYMKVVRYLKDAHDKGSIGVGFYDSWKELVMCPYIRARIKYFQEKEHSANLLANDIIKEEEKERSEVEQKKHMVKQGAISRMLKTNICNVNKDGVDESSCITGHADGLSLTSEGQRYCDNEQNNRLIGLYKDISNKRFDEALEGLSNCERENREKLDGVDMLYAARINILKFECLVESVKHACPELKKLHCHSKRIASYLGMFKSAEVYGRLPAEVSAEQLQDACDKFLPIITVLGKNNSKLEMAARYAKNATSIMRGMGEDEDTMSELELLFIQQSELKDKLVNLCEACQNISGILGIRKEVLKKIRDQGTAGDIERKTIIIDVNNLLENCKMGIKNAMALEEKLSEIDK